MRQESALRKVWVLSTLWVLLWGSLNTGPEHAWLPASPTEFLHGLRAFIPLCVGLAAAVRWIRQRPGLWPLASPLGAWSVATLAGAMASLAISPAPLTALYWTAAYASVLLILRMPEFAGSQAADSLLTLVRLNWLFIILVGIGALAIAVPVMFAGHLPSLWWSYGRRPNVGGLPMILPTGMARYGGLLAIFCFVRLLHCGRWTARLAWCALIAACAVWVSLCESRTVTAGLLITGMVLLLATGRWRLLLAATVAGLLAAAPFHQYLLARGLAWLQAGKVGGILSGRQFIWHDALVLWRDSPLLGFGFHADRLLLQGPYTSHISNAFLHMLVQTGLIGGTAFIAGWVLIWRCAAVALRRAQTQATESRRHVVECVGVLSFLFIRSMFESSGAYFGVDWLLLVPVVASLQHRACGLEHEAAFELSSAQPLPTFTVLGVPVHPITLAQTLQVIEQWVRRRDRGRHIVASGMHGIMEARRDPQVRAILKGADLFVMDGYSLVWLARRRGFSAPARVCGADLMMTCCEMAAARGYRVFFYGDTPDVLDALRRRLMARYPGLQIAGMYSPPHRPLSADEDAAVVRQINAAHPDVLWVALGMPKQERWIAAHRTVLDVPVIVGVGAAFKFVSGRVQRAPVWVGNHGLEWLWRVLHEPKALWRRAVWDIPIFTSLALAELVVSSGSNGHRAPRSFRTLSLKRWLRGVLKRGLDILLVAIGLVLSAPAWLVIAYCIKREDGGPLLYAQERVGRGGRRFRSLKFRTMVPDADARFGPRQAAEHDPRVTRVGRRLRATAMDELPQLLNILRGDMSFVGPRALVPREAEQDGDGRIVAVEEIPGHAFRHSVRPGLTGLAQVFARRDLPRQQKFRFDRLYIQRQSPRLDATLFVLSLWISLRGKWESRKPKLRGAR